MLLCGRFFISIALLKISFESINWAREIMDKDGPTIADAFYEELFHSLDGRQALKPDMAKSALALHLAVKKLRSQSVSFSRWVPFIHMGK